MSCFEEFMRVYNKLPESEKDKVIIVINNVKFTWRDIYTFIVTGDPRGCSLWSEIKKVILKSTSLSLR